MSKDNNLIHSKQSREHPEQKNFVQEESSISPEQAQLKKEEEKEIGKTPEAHVV